MTFEQLRVFLAVAEREHLTRAAGHLNLTPSAVSASIRALEQSYGVALFDRVGRRIELSEAGRLFLPEARALVARAATAAAMLGDLGGLRRGSLALQASQTIAAHWLPPLLVRFHEAHPAIALGLVTGNTDTVAKAVLDGAAELGFVEGELDQPLLAADTVAEDRLVVVVAPGHPLARVAEPAPADLAATPWILRETGSGTRSSFASGLRAHGLSIAALDVALELPSNEAVIAAVATGRYATAVSEAAASAMIAAGRLARVPFALPPRAFRMLHHRERHLTAAARAFIALIEAGLSPTAPPPPRPRPGIPAA